jgi:hypothetical protein
MNPSVLGGGRPRSSWRVVVGLLAAAFCLSACIAVPYARQSGFRGSRSDLGDSVPDFIVVGKTTRDAVIARLGHAEIEPPDGSWLYYQSHYLKSERGLWVAVASPSSYVGYGTLPSDSVVLARRLWVRFSPEGVVDAVSSDRGECKGLDAEFIEAANRNQIDGEPYGYGFCLHCYPECFAAGTGRPILQRDAEMLALRASMRRTMAVADASAESASRRFVAKWRDKHAKKKQLLGSEIHWSLVNCDVDAGELLLTPEFLFFFPRETSHAGPPAPPVRITRDSIVDVRGMAPDRPRSREDREATDLTLNDGRQVSFAICKRYADPKLQRPPSDPVADTDWLREQLRAPAR